MMFLKDSFNMTYIGDFQTKILELPYVGNELSMIILLPDAIQDGSTGLEKVSCWAKCKDSLCPSREESLILRINPQFSSKAVRSLVLNTCRNVPHLPAPKVVGMPCAATGQAVCCPLGQRLWKMTWPSSEAEFSCNYGESIAWWASYTVREDLGELPGGLFWTAGRFSLVHHCKQAHRKV